jgi:hypothetical protein
MARASRDIAFWARCGTLFGWERFAVFFAVFGGIVLSFRAEPFDADAAE